MKVCGFDRLNHRKLLNSKLSLNKRELLQTEDIVYGPVHVHEKPVEALRWNGLSALVYRDCWLKADYACVVQGNVRLCPIYVRDVSHREVRVETHVAPLLLCPLGI